MAVDDTQPLITHLIELRKRLLNCIIAVFLIFLCLVYFANDIYQVVSAPLIKQMPLGATMIATDVASPFFTPIKLTFWVSLIASAPVILYQVWAFVAPALYRHERKLVIPLLVSSSLLFYIGMLTVHTPALLLALQLLNAIYIGILAGIGMLYFQDLMPGQAGAATTLYTNTTRVGWIIAGSLAGVVAEIWNYHTVFWIALVMCVLTLSCLTRIKDV
ncbi:MAG: twin-arginine translocase subunit TatC [Enterobacter sp.]|nr:twin-arginine translocase subunit TatC [Enterobacter sp.]